MKREVVLAGVAALGVIVALGFKVQIDQRTRLDTLTRRVDALLERVEALEAKLQEGALKDDRQRRDEKLAPPTHVAPRALGSAAREEDSHQADTGSNTKTLGSVSPTAAVASAPSAEDADAKAALRAFEALAKHGVGALSRLADGKLASRFRALGPVGIELLEALLSDSESSQERMLAAALLEQLGDRQAIGALDRALNDPDVLVRRMASHALAGLKDEAALTALERALYDDADWGVRANAAYGLAKLGVVEGVEALRRFYEDKTIDPGSRLAVLGGMADVGDLKYAEIFRSLLGDAEAEISYRLLALTWAAHARDRKAVNVIQRMIDDPKSPASLREAARRALASIAADGDDTNKEQ